MVQTTRLSIDIQSIRSGRLVGLATATIDLNGVVITVAGITLSRELGKVQVRWPALPDGRPMIVMSDWLTREIGAMIVDAIGGKAPVYG